MHLPVNYLYRHAIELYLKSFIVILHKALKIPYGQHNYKSTPHVQINNNWVPIYRTHDLADLFRYFERILNQNCSKIRSISTTDWCTLPPGLDTQIFTISNIDTHSTYLRYPDLRDPTNEQTKSTFEEINLSDIFMKFPIMKNPAKIIMEYDDNEEISSVYINKNPHKQVTIMLQDIASLLEGVHLGMRIELANGE